MKIHSRSLVLLLLASCFFLFPVSGQIIGPPSELSPFRNLYNVRAFGAKGDGKALDSPAINKAIDAAAAAGGGTVFIPAGTYRSFSIRLKSNITLYFDQGSTLVAASPNDGDGRYDPPEPNKWDKYQDFGHTHWHNSLIWGENLENISILGPGLILGKGLVRGGNQSRTKEQNDAIKNIKIDKAAAPFGYPNPRDAVESGWGNKSISLKLCRNVIIRDISILHGGHFAILATGVDNLTIDNLKIDTNRDGIDIDACRHVRISNTSVNSPFDDGICLKSSHALGFPRATENVTITNCAVSGYDEGTLLDATYKREYNKYSHNSPTGRIKFGTESNGGFKNITISNCTFDYSRGLALETVDGGLLEDVAISNITMRDVVNSPIFLRLGSRDRGPKETLTTGKLRRVIISNIVAYNADPKYASIISGVPGDDIEDVRFNNIRIYYQGGGTNEQAALSPPEKEDDYPEPVMFGEMPSYGFYIRHVKGLTMTDVEVSYIKDDARPPFVLDDVKGADFHRIKAQRNGTGPTFVLKGVSDFNTNQVWLVPDTRIEQAAQKNL
ncbi:MAG TPA: glycosyl hydrolase family 28-related protein [Pyrinomonadaceae bacterium]|nr:glycosyl hydrolase family 28-related protein [Pyrinomonadaceae bacterium]